MRAPAPPSVSLPLAASQWDALFAILGRGAPALSAGPARRVLPRPLGPAQADEEAEPPRAGTPSRPALRPNAGPGATAERRPSDGRARGAREPRLRPGALRPDGAPAVPGPRPRFRRSPGKRGRLPGRERGLPPPAKLGGPRGSAVGVGRAGLLPSWRVWGAAWGCLGLRVPEDPRQPPAGELERGGCAAALMRQVRRWAGDGARRGAQGAAGAAGRSGALGAPVGPARPWEGVARPGPALPSGPSIDGVWRRWGLRGKRPLGGEPGVCRRQSEGTATKREGLEDQRGEVEKIFPFGRKKEKQG